MLPTRLSSWLANWGCKSKTRPWVQLNQKPSAVVPVKGLAPSLAEHTKLSFPSYYQIGITQSYLLKLSFKSMWLEVEMTFGRIPDSKIRVECYLECSKAALTHSKTCCFTGETMLQHQHLTLIESTSCKFVLLGQWVGLLCFCFT